MKQTSSAPVSLCINTLKLQQTNIMTVPLELKPASRPAPPTHHPTADDIKLILSDVDGTLLDNKHQLPTRTVDAIRHIRATRPDIPFIPVTGKQRVSCDFIIDALDLHAFPAACCHGSLIHAPGGELLSQASIDPEVVVGIAEKLRNANKTVLLYRATDVAMVSKESGSNTDWEQVSRGFDPMVVDQRDTDFLERVKKGEAVISKIFLPMDEECVEGWMKSLAHAYPGGYKMTRALPYVIELIPPAIDKSVAMDYFCRKFDISPSNVLAFGDGENDVGMLSRAGYGVSMGNAMEAPRKAAKYSTLTNNEGGVGHFLDSIFRPEMLQPLPAS